MLAGSKRGITLPYQVRRVKRYGFASLLFIYFYYYYFLFLFIYFFFVCVLMSCTKFQIPSSSHSLVSQAPKSRQMDKAKPIRPLNFFEVGREEVGRGDIKYGFAYFYADSHSISLSLVSQAPKSVTDRQTNGQLFQYVSASLLKRRLFLKGKSLLPLRTNYSQTYVKPIGKPKLVAKDTCLLNTGRFALLYL